MFKIISAIAVMGFVVNTAMALYEAICSNFATSIGFGLIAVVMFIVMVLCGYLGLKDDL